jgi:hypothetical protein
MSAEYPGLTWLEVWARSEWSEWTVYIMKEAVLYRRWRLSFPDVLQVESTNVT